MIVLFMNVDGCVKASSKECNISSIYTYRVDTIVENNTSSYTDKVKANSLRISNQKIDSVLSSIVNDKPDKSIWNYFFITMAKVDSIMYVEIVADVSNENIFMNILKDNIYGMFSLNRNVLFVLRHDKMNQINEIDIEKMFVKNGNTVVIKRRKGPDMYYTKYENPMWLYQFKDNDVFLVKTANIEYYKRDLNR